jgi:hypothetical protein
MGHLGLHLCHIIRALVADGLLGKLNGGGCYVIGYADDISILINGKYTVSKVLQTALGMVE